MGNHHPPGRWPRPLLDRGPRRTQGHEVPSPRISAWHRRRTAEPARAAPGTPAPQADPQRPHRTPTLHAPLDNTTSISAGRDRLEGLRTGAIDERDGVGEDVVLGVRE